MPCHTSSFAASMHECSRCSRPHNGTLPRGWGQYPGHGLLCDDCGDSLTMPEPRRPARQRGAA